MGMTEVQKLANIKVLEDLYKEYELLAKYNGGRDYDRYCALELAINTMRKYQRIQAIINNAKDSDGAVKYNWLYEQIGEVVEHE